MLKIREKNYEKNKLLGLYENELDFSLVPNTYKKADPDLEWYRESTNVFIS